MADNIVVDPNGNSGTNGGYNPPNTTTTPPVKKGGYISEQVLYLPDDYDLSNYTIDTYRADEIIGITFVSTPLGNAATPDKPKAVMSETHMFGINRTKFRVMMEGYESGIFRALSFNISVTDEAIEMSNTKSYDSLKLTNILSKDYRLEKLLVFRRETT